MNVTNNLIEEHQLILEYVGLLERSIEAGQAQENGEFLLVVGGVFIDFHCSSPKISTTARTIPCDIRNDGARIIIWF